MPIVVQTLLRKIAAGDYSAFEKLYNECFSKSYSFAIYFTKSEYLAQEAVAETFLKIWENRENLTNISDWQSYLYVLIRNQSLAQLKKHPLRGSASSFDLFSLYIADESAGPDDMVTTWEMEAALQEAFNALPERCRMVYYLVKQERRSYRDVAEILNISERTVNSQMTIAVKKLGSLLSHYFIFATPRQSKKLK